MILVTIGFGFANPSGWREFSSTNLHHDLVRFAVLVTWVTKGEYRKYCFGEKIQMSEYIKRICLIEESGHPLKH